MRKRRVEVLDVENVEKSIRMSILCFIVANDYPLFAFRIFLQQCDQMVRLFFNICPFATQKNYPNNVTNLLK